MNPARHPAWGVDSFVFFPNFMLLIWEPGWYLTYHYWPTSYNTHIFEGTLYFVPPKTARERLKQELAAVTFKEYSLQDGNTLEATQTMLESRAVTEFPLNDQEILLRHSAQDGPGPGDRVPAEVRDSGPDLHRLLDKEPRRMTTLPADFADLEPVCRLVARDRSRTLRQAPLEHHGRTPGVLRRCVPPARSGHGLPRPVRPDALPEDARRLLWLCYSLVNVSFPVEVWRQPRVPDSGAASFDMLVEPAV